MSRQRRQGSTTSLVVAALVVVVVGLTLSASTDWVKSGADPVGVVHARESPVTTPTFAVLFQASQSDPLTEYTRYSWTLGAPCNPLLDICPE
jgi:hypothetical protein